MKDRFDLRLQPARHHRLGHPVRDRWHTKGSRPTAMRFRYLHRLHRRRKVDPEDIRFQILYRLFFRSFSNSSSVTPSTPGAP